MNRVALKTTTAVIPSAPVFMRKKQLAAYLATDPWSIDRWRRAQKVGFPRPYELTSKVLVWKVREIDEWIESRRGAR